MINSVIMLNPMLTDSNPQFQFRGLPKTLTEREEGDGGDRRRDGGGESAGDGEEGMLRRERGEREGEGGGPRVRGERREATPASGSVRTGETEQEDRGGLVGGWRRRLEGVKAGRRRAGGQEAQGEQ